MTAPTWLLAAGLLAVGPAAVPVPSVDHERLDALVGSWKVERTVTAPGQPPERTTGKSENRWTLDNRYVECRLKEGEGGSATESLLLYGFDTQRRVYFSLAVSSRGTGYRNLEGFYDQPTRSFVLLGRDPGDGRAPGPKLRQVLRIESRDRHVLELFLIGTGQLPRKVTEITFTRE
jgi:uncharacterized protein DUF1579